MSTIDLSEFENLQGSRRKPPCPVGTALATLENAERDQLAAALSQANNVIGAGAISKWLARRDMKASINQVGVHRSGKCNCDD